MTRTSIRRQVRTAAFLTLAVACGGEQPAADAAASAASTPPAAAQPAAQQAAGERIYAQRCVSCHQANGLGATGVYPALAGSEYVLASDAGVPIRVVIHGLQGPITVKGEAFNSLMPAYGIGITMSDEEVAQVVTYIRTSWGNAASAVTAAEVASVREAAKSHSGAMTAELLRPLMAK